VKSLIVIGRTINQSRNRNRREVINNALIVIGIRNNALEHETSAVVAKFGTVVVDHRETSCKTTDAARCIKNAKMRKRK
jgi:hypothetical protein